jgi:hypothetical protein
MEYEGWNRIEHPGDRCAHHIARCSWAGNILRVAPGDQLGLKVGIIGVEKLLARAGVEVFALVSAIPPPHLW